MLNCKYSTLHIDFSATPRSCPKLFFVGRSTKRADERMSGLADGQVGGRASDQAGERANDVYG